MSKVSSCWVPRNVNVHDWHQRVASCHELLDLYTSDKEKFCRRLIAGHKPWIHNWAPESKLESMQWKHVTCPPSRKFRTQRPVGKSNDNNFWGF